MKDRWIALYVENQVGVLAKISGLFAGKSYNLCVVNGSFKFIEEGAKETEKAEE